MSKYLDPNEIPLVRSTCPEEDLDNAIRKLGVYNTFKHLFTVVDVDEMEHLRNVLIERSGVAAKQTNFLKDL